MGPGCREFESRHSDQKSRIRFCGVWTFLFVWSETRTIKCDADERRRRGLGRADPLSAPFGPDANESRHSDQNRQFSARKLAVLNYFEYQNREILPSRILYIARTCSSDIFSVRIRYISFLRSYKKTCKAFSALSNVKEYSSIK